MVKRPKLKRIEASAWVGVRPRARRTCEGSGIPEVQAEPVEAARWWKAAEEVIHQGNRKPNELEPMCYTWWNVIEYGVAVRLVCDS